MGFEALSPKAAADRARYGDRLPPGQRLSEKWPVLHYGSPPEIALDSWELSVSGLVAQSQKLDWLSLLALPQSERTSDAHCVTRWSTFDNVWTGVAATDILALAPPKPEAKFVVAHAYGGYSANLPLSVFAENDVILAHSHASAPLTLEHGWPLRLVVPSRYFWKSVKWLRALEFVADDQPGFWERYGYHNEGDPWQEQRFTHGRSRTGAY